MPISKPDHVQVHRIEFGKGTNINGLVKELETSAKHIRYGAYATAGAIGLTAAGLTYGLYKLGQGIADACEDFDIDKAGGGIIGSAKSAWQVNWQLFLKGAKFWE